MNEATTSNTRHCDGCAVALTPENHGFFEWRDTCNRCHGRTELNGHILDVAYVANQFYKRDEKVDDLQHDIATLRVRIQELRKDIQADDSRVEHLWSKLWNALDGDIERNETWGLFIDAIDGVPDYRVEKVDGCITLKFFFTELEIDGSLTGSTRDDAIIEAFLKDNDFEQDNADETEVEVD